MERNIYVEGKPVRMRTSARIHSDYRECFGKDLISELTKFKTDSEEGNQNYEVFENLAWLMTKKAGEQVHPPELTAQEAVAAWLDGFETSLAIVNATSQIVGLYSAGNKTNSKPRKNPAPRPEN